MVGFMISSIFIVLLLVVITGIFSHFCLMVKRGTSRWKQIMFAACYWIWAITVFAILIGQGGIRGLFGADISPHGPIRLYFAPNIGVAVVLLPFVLGLGLGIFIFRTKIREIRKKK